MFTLPMIARRIWNHLTDPSAQGQPLEQREQARLLSALALVLFCAALIILTIWIYSNPLFTAAPAISFGVVSGIAFVYGLSRSRYHRIGAFLLVATFLGVVVAVLVFAPGPMSERMSALNFLVIAILIANILLDTRTTAIVAALSIMLTAIFFELPGVAFTSVYSLLVFVVVSSALLVVTAIMRDRHVRARKQAEAALILRTEELTALQTTVLEITSPRPLDALLQTLVERAMRLIDAGGGGLYLTDPEQQQVRCVVSVTPIGEYTGTVLKYGEGAAGYVAQTGQPLIIDNYAVWSGRAHIFEQVQPFRTVMSAPLLWQGKVTGVIHVLNKRNGAYFSQTDLDLLMMFANHAAVAVEHAHLLSDLEQELVERKRTEHLREELIVELQEALAQVKRLGGLLPICAECKKIRDDQGYWQQVEVYIRDHSEARFSHGICPDCTRKLYPELFEHEQA